MADRIIKVAEGFWNIRGSFRLGGVVPIGTQSSLVKLDDGRFVLLDAYTLSDDLLGQVRDLTSGGRDIDAIINLHPFHTIHVKRAHAQHPGARLFGSQRHIERADGLPWQTMRSDDPGMEAEFPGLQFTVPRGVDFISDDPNVHVSSVLAYHVASRTLHIDDTFNYADLPLLRGVRLHPMLKKALRREAGAAAEFRAWGAETVARWGAARNLCAAHSSALLDQGDLAGQMTRALKAVEGVLRAHERTHGTGR